ncbi:hypothetical protein M9H77_04694 [Catharanthus roseus]|uniref:Uncharacterized protein n=1 Tax=Catharanthus roseus TaxID=4058 RepID=A0ACC0CEV0_CATRO|nr:hypothetical protein M9H77_04694 [Catharanthus roseus]
MAKINFLGMSRKFQVIKTKSVKYMPFWLIVFNLSKGGIWTGYVVEPFDLFVVIPKALGTLSDLIQLILYMVFWLYQWNPNFDVAPPASGVAFKPKKLNSLSARMSA